MKGAPVSSKRSFTHGEWFISGACIFVIPDELIEAKELRELTEEVLEKKREKNEEEILHKQIKDCVVCYGQT
jgi:hypothetical protein